jgi:hypothetical protein
MMLDLREGIVGIFETPSPADVLHVRYLAWQKADRAKWKKRRVVTAVASLEFPMSCRFCREGCHSERHVDACQVRISRVRLFSSAVGESGEVKI